MCQTVSSYVRSEIRDDIRKMMSCKNDVGCVSAALAWGIIEHTRTQLCVSIRSKCLVVMYREIDARARGMSAAHRWRSAESATETLETQHDDTKISRI